MLPDETWVYPRHGDDTTMDLGRRSRRKGIKSLIDADSSLCAAAHAGPFVLLEFETATPVVHLEHHRSSAFLRDQGDVAAYLRQNTRPTDDASRGTARKKPTASRWHSMGRSASATPRTVMAASWPPSASGRVAFITGLKTYQAANAIAPLAPCPDGRGRCSLRPGGDSGRVSS